jgi:hypothetical protein
MECYANDRCAPITWLLDRWKQSHILGAGLLTVTLAIPWMFEGWQVRPVLFAGQGLPRRFALNLSEKHPAQVVAAVYRI